MTPNLYSHLKRFSGSLGLPGVLMLLWALFAAGTAQAQLDYTNATSRSEYVPLATGDVLTGGPVAQADDAVYPTITLPFSFIFNGVGYTQITPNTNGVIFMGSTGGTAYGTFFRTTTTGSGTMPVFQCLFPFAADMMNGSAARPGEIKTFTEGTAPDRKFIVQYTNFMRLSVTTSGVNMQVIFNETTNVLEYHYGTWLPSSTATLMTVGFRATATDFYTLGTSTGSAGTDTTEWINAVRNTSNSPALTYNTTVIPNPGVKYTFTPLVPAANDLSVRGFINVPTSGNTCDSSLVNGIGVVVLNRGSNPAGPARVSVTLTDNTGAVIDNLDLRSNRTDPMNTGQLDTLYFPNPIQLIGTNAINMLAVNGIPDDQVLNDTVRSSLAGTLNCGTPPPYTYSTSVGTFTALTGGTTATITQGTLADGYAQIPIPFIFAFNGQSFANVNVSTNGFINFSDLLPASNFIYSNTGLFNYFNLQPNTVAAFAVNLTARSITYGIDPTTTDFVIEYTGTVATGGDVNFQYRLKRDYSVEIVYNTATATSTSTPTVGLGLSNTSFYALSHGGNSTWENAYSTTTNNTTMLVTATTTIPAGLSYLFTPTFTYTVPVNDLAVVNTLNVPTATNNCDSSTFNNIGVIVRSAGIGTLATYGISVTIVNSLGVTVSNNTYSGTNLVSGAIDTLFLDPIQVLGIDNYRVSVRVSAADDQAANDSTAFNLQTTLDCQAPPYTYSTSLGTFTPLTGGTTITTWDGGSFNPPSYGYSTISLPRLFAFNGDPYTSVNVSTNGYINFSSTPPGSFNYTDNGYWNIQYDRNVVAGFARNLFATEVVYGIDAASGDFVIQYTGQQYDFGPLEGYVRFQYRLKSDFSIVLSYDSAFSNTVRRPTVGLGISNTSFIALSRGSANTWVDAISTSSPSSTMAMGPGISVPSGLNFVFTPTFNFVVPVNDLGILRAINVPTSTANCDSSTFSNIGIIVSSAGINALTSYGISVAIVNSQGAIVNTNTYTGSDLASGSTDTLFIDAIQVAGIDSYTIRVGVLNADDYARNDSTSFILQTTLNCRTPNYDFSSAIVPYNRFTGGTLMNFANADDGVQNITLPVPVTFNDTAYTQLQVSTNGVISFNRVMTPSDPRATINTNNANNSVFIFLQDFRLLECRYGVDSSTNDFVIEYYGNYYQTPNSDSVRAQYRFQPDNTIILAYATTSITNTTFPASLTTQVGLRIDGGSFYTMVTGTGNWADATPTGSVTSLMPVSTNNVPSGLQYIFTPPTATPSVNLAATSIVNATATNCTGNSITPRLIASSIGALDVNTYDVRVRVVSPSNVVTVTTLTRNVASFTRGTTDSVSLGNIDFTESGTYRISARVLAAGDIRSNNDSIGILVAVSQSINVAPVVTVTGSTTICPGDVLTLTAPVNSFYRWNTGQTTRSITVSQTGTYKVRVGNSATCLSPYSDSVVVTAPNSTPRPTVTASGTTSFCGGSPISVTLTSSASDRYRWSTGDTTQSITVTTTGNYYVYTTLNSLGCRSFNSDTVRVTSSATINTPIVNANGPITFCAGSNVRLTCSVAATAGGSYLWSNGAVTRVTTTRAITVDTAGSYTVIVTNAAGCSSAASSSTVITVNTAPAATTISATGSTNFCLGGSVTLTAVAVGSASYQWFNNNVALANATNSTYDATASGTYTVKLSNGTCTGPASNGIVVTAAAAPNVPSIALSGPNAICDGSSITATASSTTPGCRFIWSSGDTTRVMTINNALTLSVRSINATGCTSTTASADVVTTISPSAGIPTITRSGDTLIATGADNATGYIWTRNGVTIPVFRGRRYPITLDATTSGTYTYTVKSQIGVCISAVSEVFTITSLTGAVSRSADLKAFPVPATNVLNVSLAQVNGTYAVIRLVDNLGKVVMVQNVAVNGSLNTQLELNGLPAGMYQLLVNGDGLAVSRTITKK